MKLVSMVKTRSVWSCFLKAGGRGTLLWTIPANPGTIIRAKVLPVSKPKVREARKTKTWLRECGQRAITVEIVKPGTKMRGNTCLEKHPCPHLKWACCCMIPIGESSHESDRSHALNTKKWPPCCLCGVQSCVWWAWGNYHQLLSSQTRNTVKSWP